MLLLEDKLTRMAEAVSAIIPDNFGKIDDLEDDIYGVNYSDLYDLLEQIDPAVEIETGASKLVIIPSFGNYVIKIPFRGIWYLSYCSDEYDEYSEYDDYFEEFEGTNSDNYCQDELEEYNMSVLNNMYPLFAETSYFGKFNGVDFYLQEKVSTNSLEHSSKKESYDKVKKITSSYHNSGFSAFNWLGNVLEYYGEKTVILALDYIQQQDICDIHDSNVGYRANGEPVLIDFSGWGG